MTSASMAPPVLGQGVPSSVLIDPTSLHRLAHPDGELAAAWTVLIASPVHWGPAVGGESGVRHVLELRTTVMARDLLLCGPSGPAAADRSLLVREDVPLVQEG